MGCPILGESVRVLRPLLPAIPMALPAEAWQQTGPAGIERADFSGAVGLPNLDTSRTRARSGGRRRGLPQRRDVTRSAANRIKSEVAIEREGVRLP